MSTTLTQSENLKIGQRGEFEPTAALRARMGQLEGNIKLWVEKRKKAPDEFEKNLRAFVDDPSGFELVYGITYKGRDFECGNIPRDLRTVIRGIEIAERLQ